jgi:hypothetical protein
MSNYWTYNVPPRQLSWSITTITRVYDQFMLGISRVNGVYKPTDTVTLWGHNFVATIGPTCVATGAPSKAMSIAGSVVKGPVAQTTKHYWWFGTFELFFHILGIIIPTYELIFFRGVETTNQKPESHLIPTFFSNSG